VTVGGKRWRGIGRKVAKRRERSIKPKEKSSNISVSMQYMKMKIESVNKA
jgi:hypothetical protein